MARSFPSSGTAYLSSSTSPAGISSIEVGVIAFWFYPNWSQSDGVNHVYWWCQKDSNNRFGMQKYTDNKLYFGFRVNTTQYRITVTSYTQYASRWNCFIFTWDYNESSNWLKLYLNGSSIGTYSTRPGSNLLFDSYEKTWNLSSTYYLNGLVAETVVFAARQDARSRGTWLSDQITGFSKGLSPWMIGRRDSTTSTQFNGRLYARMLGAELLDEIDGVRYANTGTSAAANHPPVYMPERACL